MPSRQVEGSSFPPSYTVLRGEEEDNDEEDAEVESEIMGFIRVCCFACIEFVHYSPALRLDDESLPFSPFASSIFAVIDTRSTCHTALHSLFLVMV